MTDRYPALSRHGEPQTVTGHAPIVAPSLAPTVAPSLAPTVAGLAPIVAPSLARSPGVSPILAHHEPEAAVAFGGEGERSAERLRSDVARVAGVLPDTGDDDPREILCVATDRYHFAVALLAAWQRGHRVALPPNAQPELLRAMADDPAISLVIHDTDEMTGLDLRPLLADDIRATPAGALELAPLPALRKLVSVWTSGSTGEHQRHAKTAGQLFAEALTLAEHFGLAERGKRGAGRARVVATVPSHHIYGLLFSVLVPLVSGGSFSRETPLHAGVVRATLMQTPDAVLVSVPAHLRALRILDPGALPPLSRVFSSGAPLPPDTAKMLSSRFGLTVTEVLGSTETGGIASRLSGPELLESDDAAVHARAWSPLPHVRVKVDADGRLLVDSPFLPPDGPRPWPTADRVEMVQMVGGLGHPGPRFRHFGRVDGVVKVGGKRVALAEIERRLHAIEGVEDAAVSVVEVGGARGQETVALVVAPGLSPEHLRGELRRWLDPVVIPRRLRLVDALPREPNGKLTRRRLLEIIEGPSARIDALECRAIASEGEGPGRVAEFEVYVPRDLYCLRGHFRGAPIVPGVAQLELARSVALTQWPALGQLRAVRRLKYLRPVRPGERLRLVLDHRAEDRVDFRLLAGAEPVSVGTLSFTAGS
ncbi:putative sulfoacetate--CoA ligase [Enhygromyxa salina]|uniref:Putative sulfoacetate--CoA ligase n=1 Tax=Enhygromyxa salina TaxID=215803 RepID=A0A2S9YF15_9BACT|nr:AMP-binding protein [Enhygromyxa salina]PRQ03693.1 putative sulfoacetate--CoA ligase [Enhygromyxa salina]